MRTPTRPESGLSASAGVAGPDDPYALKFPVVALVSSLGGLDALSQVLAPLPADLPAALLVVQHLDPDQPSHLAPVLDRRTALNVRPAVNDDELVMGTVLVAPPARHLLVTSEARVGLIESGALPPWRPSADLLLATLAVTCGPRALAVVLTGKGHDAQAGIRAVCHCGGTVLAQDPTSSAHLGMPAAAISTDLVDRVLPFPTSPVPSKPTFTATGNECLEVPMQQVTLIESDEAAWAHINPTH